MQANPETISLMLERIAFLEIVQNKLDALNEFSFFTFMWVMLSVLAMGFWFQILLSKKPATTNLTLKVGNCLCGILIVIVAMYPTSPSKTEELAKLKAAVMGVPPEKVIHTWSLTSASDYLPTLTFADHRYSFEIQVSNLKQSLQIEVASSEFELNGGLEKLKKEIIESAQNAEKQGRASAGQLALLNQNKQQPSFGKTP